MKPIGMRYTKLLQLHVALGLCLLLVRKAREQREQRALLHVLTRVETDLK